MHCEKIGEMLFSCIVLLLFCISARCLRRDWCYGLGLDVFSLIQGRAYENCLNRARRISRISPTFQRQRLLYEYADGIVLLYSDAFVTKKTF